MSVSTEDGNGVNITAVHTGLEFPHGGSSTKLSIRSIPNHVNTAPPTTHAKAQSEAPPSLATKAMTECPPPTTTKDSFVPLKRTATGAPPALDNALWQSMFASDSDLSTSSDEEAPRIPLQKTKTKTSSGLGKTQSKGKVLSEPQNDRGDHYGKFSVGNDKFKSRGKVSKKDGRLKISVNETANSGYLAKALGAAIKHHIDGDDEIIQTSPTEQGVPQPVTVSRITTSSATLGPNDLLCPKLNIVIMVIGSRGDIQPFLKIGKVLREDYGHRVRIATHPAFKSFVEKDAKLEFFSIGGDPAELMAFMVKNPGLIPSLSTVRAGEIGRRREQMFEMFQGFWRACINATDDETDDRNLKMMGNRDSFIADAIIANPPCFAHMHCAERLGVPLHLIFTFPYSPTQEFAHPLANIKSTNVDMKYTNFMSYPLVEMMTWQGLGDLVNRFRVEDLGLDPVSTLWAPGQLYRFKVPYTYLWSPGLIPKPQDWGPEVDIAGFVFLELASSFKPPQSLVDFLDAGEPPIYVGFGSIVVDDPDRFTNIVFGAVKEAGVRALVSKGWGGLGNDDVPDNIYMLDNCPHDWLFPRVSAVIHHGGAGTTAIGLKCGKPTMIIPFFGDQPFWAAMVAKAGAGYTGRPLPYKRLTVEALADGILECLSDDAKLHAGELAEAIAAEGDGARNAVQSFHQSLPLRGEISLRCAIFGDRAAVWNVKNTNFKLSALAATLLVETKKVSWRNLRLWRTYEWNDFAGPGEPFTGGGAAVVRSVGGVAKGIGGIPVRWAKSIRRHERHDHRRRSQLDAKSNEANGATASKPDASPTVNDQNAQKINGIAVQDHAQGPGRDNVPSVPAIETNDGDLDDESVYSYDLADNVAQEMALDTGRGLEESGRALARAPVDIALALAQGFHNAPRLYGDTTVRRPIRISGFHSGMKAARNEFVYGIRDGVTGLVTQPYAGAREEGFAGFVKGTGKGIGGIVLKDIAALVGPVAYFGKGVQAELQKKKQSNHFIRRARIRQGAESLQELSRDEKAQALKKVRDAWKVYQDIRKLIHNETSHGLRGKFGLHRERVQWERHGAFENVQQAQRGLEAKQRGESFDDVFRAQRAELRKQQHPRQNAMTNIKDEDARPRTPNRKKNHNIPNGQSA
ncbi:MAG: hypothetical protein M1833_001624 [Piccolia ochrophora]|nr:MAG: hypothetical protein M1833_001624 [Piccolia ochrophora]